MNSLNLKGFAASTIACVLVIIMMIFPSYIASLMVDNSSTLILLALLSATLVFYIHWKVDTTGYGMLITKLALLTISYIFLFTAVLKLSGFNFGNDNYRALLTVTALYSIGTLLLFKSAFLKIYANIVLIGSLLLIFLTSHNYINFGDYCAIVLLCAYIILSLSANAIRYYSFLIALVIIMVIMNFTLILFSTFNIYLSTSAPHFVINYLPLLALTPFIVNNRKKFSPSTIKIIMISVVILAILQSLLPTSVISGVIIVALALYLQSRALHILGIILFIGSLYFYYYSLNTTLSMKGLILIGSGTVILLTQWLITRIITPNTNCTQENNHAH